MPPPRVFLGRDAELAMLVAASVSDSGRFILVRGEGGIGKTTLLAAAVGQIPPGHTVLHGSADAMDRRRTHGLLLDAFAPMLDEDGRRTAARQHQQRGRRATPLLLIDMVAKGSDRACARGSAVG